MPRVKGSLEINNFVRGIVTEASDLAFPDNASLDEENCILFTKGNRRRRLGIDYEQDYTLSASAVPSGKRKTYEWEIASSSSTIYSFSVVQCGDTIYFYDLSKTPLSSGIETFTINLNTYAVGGSFPHTELVSMYSGKDYLFICSKTLEPIYVTYNPTGDTITVGTVGIMIRDFEGVDDSLANDAQPATLSAAHEYNLKNQGWVPSSPGGASPITTYFTAKATYPSNSKQWWSARNSSNVFDPTILDTVMTGTSLAARGHYVLNPFNKDRSTVSGVAGITTVTKSTRPTAVSFMSGRAFFGYEGQVFFTQVLEGVANIGRCYQDGDPTSEEYPDLLATDGGYVNVLGGGQCTALFEMYGSMLFLSPRGVWNISGAEGEGFKATNFRVEKVSDIGCSNANTVVSIEGVPMWWNADGIYTITTNDVSGRMSVVSVTKNTIQTLFNQIDNTSVDECFGNYDKGEKRCYWCYRDDNNYDMLLILDTQLGAFYKWRIQYLSAASPRIKGIVSTETFTPIYESASVIAGSDTVITGSTNVTVTSVDDDVVGYRTYLKFLVEDSAGKITFADFSNRSFKDWEKANSVGEYYESFLEAGNTVLGAASKTKQISYIYSYFNLTETGWVYNGTDWSLLNPSGCYVQLRWDWNSSAESNKWTKKEQAYYLNLDEPTDTSETELHTGKRVIISKKKLRGNGKSVRVRYLSEQGKDFNLLGWCYSLSMNNNES